MFHLDRPMYLLGYLAGQSKVYLIDKVSTSLLSHSLPSGNCEDAQASNFMSATPPAL